MATNLQFSITLKPAGYDSKWPNFYLKIDDALQDQGELTEERTYNFDVTLQDGAHSLVVGFTNKQDSDTVVVNDDLSANGTCRAITYYGDASNMTGIPSTSHWVNSGTIDATLAGEATTTALTPDNAIAEETATTPRRENFFIKCVLSGSAGFSNPEILHHTITVANSS